MTPRLRILPALVVVACLALGTVFTAATVHLQNRATVERFDRLADISANLLSDRINQHIALLQATRSYYESLNGDISRQEFARYVGTLGLSDRYRGIQGIGFAALVPRDRADAAAEAAARAYGVPVTVRPPVTQDRATPIVMLEPMDARNQNALGYDMFSEPVRRAAMLAALDTEMPQASGPVELVQEITSDKQAGFLVYLPAHRTVVGPDGASRRIVSGFIYAPFRAGDLARAALGPQAAQMQVTVSAADLGQPDVALYDSGASDIRQPRKAVRDFDVAGRTWRVTVTEARGFALTADMAPATIVGTLSVLLSVAAALWVLGMQRNLISARETADMADRMARERALLLQEMKHRIKNHIARIQAIARHTAGSTENLNDFVALFSSRLRAMADAQDLLTGDGRDVADLRDLIGNEIGQMMGRDGVTAALDGPSVRLDARQSQALSLVTHELTTNAMKYGGTPDRAPAINVRWYFTDGDAGDTGDTGAGGDAAMNGNAAGGARHLHLDWQEPGARPAPQSGDTPARRGFGSELLEMMVEGELGGTLTRTLGDDGLSVRIRFPLPA